MLLCLLSEKFEILLNEREREREILCLEMIFLFFPVRFVQAVVFFPGFEPPMT